MAVLPTYRRPAPKTSEAVESADAIGVRARHAVPPRHSAEFEIGTLSDNLGYAMRRAQLAMYAPLREELEATGMTPQRYTALGLIGAHEDISQADLGYMLAVARSGAMSIVNALEQLGCITRRRDPNDKRSYLLKLTPEGQRIVDRLHAGITRLDRRGSDRLTPEERAQLMEMLDRLALPYDD